MKSTDGSSPLSGIRSVAVGGYFALALTDAGQVLSWRSGLEGALGDGLTRPRGDASGLPAPVLAPSGNAPLTDIFAIGASNKQGFAIDSTGAVLIWGAGASGALGQGTEGNGISPLPIALKTPDGTGSLSIGPVSYWPNPTRRATP